MLFIQGQSYFFWHNYVEQYSPKGGITPEEDHEDLTTSWKIEGQSENVVKMKPFQVFKIILRPYHVLTTFTPRPCQVLTTSIRFPTSSYHALTTLTPFIVRSYYILNTTKQTALRAYHAFSTFELHIHYNNYYIEHILLQQIQTFSIECHYY